MATTVNEILNAHDIAEAQSAAFEKVAATLEDLTSFAGSLAESRTISEMDWDERPDAIAESATLLDMHILTARRLISRISQ